MPPWMLSAPDFHLSAAQEAACAAAWAARELDMLPHDLPKWVFLRWLTGQGHLLHGSPLSNIHLFEPCTPHDLSGDEFSSRTGVFATSDALWALMYALRGSAVTRMVNMAAQFGGEPMVYFLSLATDDPQVKEARELLASGFVYVLPHADFEKMPAYDWPSYGQTQEPQWLCPHEVTPLGCLAVGPKDFPLPVRLHDRATVDARCQADPWGFPWLDAEE